MRVSDLWDSHARVLSLCPPCLPCCFSLALRGARLEQLSRQLSSAAEVQAEASKQLLLALQAAGGAGGRAAGSVGGAGYGAGLWVLAGFGAALAAVAVWRRAAKE